MAKNCPNCGAPIEKFQSQCAYCGSEIEDENGVHRDTRYPLAPYGGKIVAEINLPMEMFFMLEKEHRLESFCKDRIFEEMKKEILEHISIRTCVEPTTDFCKGPYRVRGTLVLGALPDFYRVNGKSYMFMEGDYD